MADEDSKLRPSQKAWREANKDRLKAYAAAYYAANKERLDRANVERYRANPDAYKERARKWEKKNIERKRELRAEYRAKYRDRIKEFSRVDWQKHNAKRRAAKATHRAKFPELAAHYVRLRQTRKKQATPVWADLAAIKAIYKQAAELSKQTGVKHHVDHEIPLKHPLVCGLHVPANLRVIRGAENQSKGNKFGD